MDAWWMNAKIYELYVDKFAGNFNGLTAKLDHFTFLGINALHILPHYPSPMVDDGYDISDYENVRPELGTLADFDRFIEGAHARGIRVLTDLVTNHVSSEHPWFIAARASKTNSHRNFFIWSDTGAELPNAPNPFRDFKASNWIPNGETNDFYYATFYPEQPDLNWDNPAVVEEILARIDFWVDRGVDGFRLDAVPFLIEREGTSSLNLPATHRVVASIRHHLDTKYGPRVALLAEVGSGAQEAAAYFGAGHECELVYHFELMAHMFLALMRRDTTSVESLARDSFTILPERAQWATFLRNHDDLNLSMLPDGERKELLRFLDPDNRYEFNKGTGVSVRLGTIFEKNPERIIEAHQLLYSLPGAPILYYGDEIGMRNLDGTFSDTRRHVRGAIDWNVVDAMRLDASSPLNRIAKLIHDRHVVR